MTSIETSHIDLDSLISPATRQNWRKLGILQNQNLDLGLSNLANPKSPQNHTQITKPKLTTRANKKLSYKNIIPTEYFCNANNIALIERIVRLIIQKNYSTKKRHIFPCDKSAKSKKSLV